jgi:arylsulfatase A-like enzyme/Flp pilus assembly protein TadD
VRLSVAAAAVIVLLFLSFGLNRRLRLGISPSAQREPGLNVLLITIDTLRADAVGAYGQTGGVTPSIDALAAAGARFDNAHAHNVVTLPSHANILSGRLPPEHGVRDNAGFRFPSEIDTLTTILKAQRYRTGAFVSAFPLDSRFGLARGFDEYDDRLSDAARPAFLIQERRGAETVSSARRWIESQSTAPWFCWVHIYEPHYPYAPPEPFAARFPTSLYHGDVSAGDAALQPLLAPILSAGRDGRTLVVLTSDHGESLGEHGEATHGVFAYEAVLKVPLVIYQPRLFKPAVIDTPAGHVDLLPTILDAVSLPVPSGLTGRSLVPDMSGSPPAAAAAPTYFEALSASLNRRWAPLDGIILDNTKYIELPVPELYDLTRDPREANNLASTQPARVEKMRARLQQLRGPRPIATPAAESEETRDRLKSLGYVTAGASRAARHFSEADDPKRLIAYDARLQDIVALYLDGDVEGALARCQGLLAERPDMPLALFYLAHLERERGNLRAAIHALRKAVALVPDNAETVAMLGATLAQDGRPAEAVLLLEPYARREHADVEVLTTRAIALAKLGRTKEALSDLSHAQAQDPSNGALLVEMGTVHLLAGHRGQARESWAAALAANPGLARAHSSLGLLDLEDQRPLQALDHWKAAVAADAREYKTIFALGLSLAQAGRTAEARTALEFFVAGAPRSRFGKELEHARAVLTTLH